MLVACWGRETTEEMIGPAINTTRALRSAVWSHKNIREADEPLDSCQTEGESSISLGLDHNPSTSEVSILLFVSLSVYHPVIFFLPLFFPVSMTWLLFVL